MPDFSTLYIFGAGGHGRELAWLARQCWGARVKVHFVVDDAYLPDHPIDDIDVWTPSSLEPDPDARFIVALGRSASRRRGAAELAARGLQPAVMVHPRAELSARVHLGDGDVVCAGSVLTTSVWLGRHVHVNVGCTVSHDVRVGDFSTLSPGAHIAGRVHIGSDVFLGMGANVINGSARMPLVIGDGATVAAGACVTGPVAPGAMVAGVPAVRKR